MAKQLWSAEASRRIVEADCGGRPAGAGDAAHLGNATAMN